MRRLTSRKNPAFRRILSLLTAQGAKKHQQILISGRKLIPEFVRGPEALELLTTDKLLKGGAGTEIADLATNQIVVLSPELFRELDVFNTQFPLLVAKAPTLDMWDSSKDIKGLEIFCGLGNPLNVGALLRSAEAFGAEQVVMLRESCYPYHPKVLRSSAGSALKLKLLEGPSIADLTNLKNLVVLSLKGENIRTFSWPRDVRLLMGEEGAGLPHALDLNSMKIRIPTEGVESLNAVAATSIALFSYREKWPRPEVG